MLHMCVVCVCVYAFARMCVCVSVFEIRGTHTPTARAKATCEANRLKFYLKISLIHSEDTTEHSIKCLTCPPCPDLPPASCLLPSSPAARSLLSFPLNATGLCKYRWTTEPAAWHKGFLLYYTKRAWFFYCPRFLLRQLSRAATDVHSQKIMHQLRFTFIVKRIIYNYWTMMKLMINQNIYWHRSHTYRLGNIDRHITVIKGSCYIILVSRPLQCICYIFFISVYSQDDIEYLPVFLLDMI